MSHLIAAVDESMRGTSYLMCAAVASTNDRPHIRQSLRAMLLPNQRRLHAKRESLGRKRALLKSFADLPMAGCYIAVGRGRAESGRQECLEALTRHVLSLRVRELVIERCDDGTVRRDSATLEGLERDLARAIIWRHEAPEAEPLLWVSDLVLNAYGIGGELRSAAQAYVAGVVELD